MKTTAFYAALLACCIFYSDFIFAQSIGSTQYYSGGWINSTNLYHNGTDVSIGGATSPFGKLHILSTSHAGIYLERTGYQTKIRMGISQNGGPNGLRFQMSPDAGSTWNGDAFFIGDNGKIGIGTVIPIAKLHIIDNNNEGLAFTHSTDSRLQVRAGLTFEGSTSTDNRLAFYGSTNNFSTSTEALSIYGNGHVCINRGAANTNWGTPLHEFEVYGTTGIYGDLVINSSEEAEIRLNSNGFIEARELEVHTNGMAPDYVFEEDYNLLTLDQVDNYIKEYKHLPRVPPGSELEDGYNVGEMQYKLLEKIEELTLYVIEQNKELNKLKTQLKKLENE